MGKALSWAAVEAPANPDGARNVSQWTSTECGAHFEVPTNVPISMGKLRSTILQSCGRHDGSQWVGGYSKSAKHSYYSTGTRCAVHAVGVEDSVRSSS